MQTDKRRAAPAAGTAVPWRPRQAPQPLPPGLPPDHLARHYRGECDCGFRTAGQAGAALLHRLQPKEEK